MQSSHRFRRLCPYSDTNDYNEQAFASRPSVVKQDEIERSLGHTQYTIRPEMIFKSVYVPRIIALVALIQITFIQLRFFISETGCLSLADSATPNLSFEDDVSKTIKDTDNRRNTVSEFTSLEQEIKATEVHDHAEQPPPDGTFMNHPIYYRSPAELQSFHSTAHCIGDNFVKELSRKSKSCQFQNLCFDTISHDFVIFASPEQLRLERTLSNSSLTFFSASSTMLNNSVSISGLNPKWARDTARMEWFPKLLDVNHILAPDGENGGVYELPYDVVMLPFHSPAGMNVGHLIWGDWLPLYTILEIFDHLDQKPLFIRHLLKDGPEWASCDYHKNVKKCASMMSKFLPLLGVGDPSSFNKLWTIHDFNFTAGSTEAKGGSAKSRYICGQNGLAGLGMLTDHGKNLHGWRAQDYVTSHNSNRGGSLYRFRNYMMDNIGVSTAPLQNMKNSKFKIVFSINSSVTGARSADFKFQSDQLKKLEKKYDMEIVKVQMSTLNMMDQIELMSTTSIFVTVCGGGAVSAAFLPKGASLLLFFNEYEGLKNSPARLDWDMWNNLGYIRTHWLLRVQRRTLEIDYEAFVMLVDHELDIISHL